MDKKNLTSALPIRPPVVTILGHVDHGKTTLLDAIRTANVAVREHGGITQHIGAYQIIYKNSPITFIDTPGHAAFSAMRSRGARVADIIILVVAADDGVKPQTKEAIKIAKETKVPIIVAANKMDLPGANLEKLKQQLSQEGVLVEGYGGDVVILPISAKTKQGLDDLLGMIVLVAQMQELKADPKTTPSAVVIESRLDRNRGPVATVIVKEGTLKAGDRIEVEGITGKIKALIDDQGKNIKEAQPAKPVEILGLSQVPSVGTVIEEAKGVPAKRQVSIRRSPAYQMQTIDSLPTLLTPVSTDKKLSVVLKADVAGSLEAIVESIPKEIKIVSMATGNITPSDILQASSVGGLVIGFNVGFTTEAERLAVQEKVLVKTYQVIYELLEEIGEVSKSLSQQVGRGKISNRADIIAEFGSGKSRVAGCLVQEGSMKTGQTVNLVRDGQTIGQAKIVSLRRGKETVDQAPKGIECGMVIDPQLDFQVGDQIESHSK